MKENVLTIEQETSIAFQSSSKKKSLLGRQDEGWRHCIETEVGNTAKLINF